jgi:phosphate transport system protein
MPNEHTHKPFDVDIDAIRSAVTAMGGLVERQFIRSVDAVRHGDLGLAMQVLADERVVNQMHVESDLRCNQVIAKRQPIAIDLREIIAVIHGINDLERIGDEAKKIALKARGFEGGKLPIPVGKVLQMSELVSEMLRDAIDAFVRKDASTASRLATKDADVDALRDELVAELVDRMAKDPAGVSEALAMVFVVQSIERVGDHAKNLAEYVVTVVEGFDPRHGRVAGDHGRG